MLSFWEQKELIHYDYIVVGSGITGLSTACVIKERKPNDHILVLERGLLPTGASTKNAGFACIGSLSEKVYDLALMGEDKLLQLIENRWIGLQLLRKRLGDTAIDFQNNGGYELILNHESNAHLEHLSSMNDRLRPIFKQDVFKEDKSKIGTFGFNANKLQSILVNSLEGQINTGKMMNALHQYASSLGIKIITGADVSVIEENDKYVLVHANSSYNNIAFKASKVAICTNAFTRKLFPHLEINPGRGQVLVTSSIPDLKVKGIFSFDEGFYYFRNFENRIIFGGGRNLDFEKEATTSFETNEKIIAQLQQYLSEMIIPNYSYTIEQTWTGIMAFGPNKLPLLQSMSDRIAMGVRLNGMGVALGSKIAEDLADILLSDD
jgi:glycine/D-amino acid oxidase-like deaminating enzyme